MRNVTRVWRLFGIGGIALLLLVLAPGAARAQGYVSPLVGYDFGGDSGCPAITGCEDRNLNLGVSVGSLGRVFGTELELAYARDFFGDAPGLASSVLTLMANVMLAPRFGAAQPYAVIGLGLIKTRVEFTPVQLLDAGNSHLGWDVGGGLMVFVTRHIGVRGDVRYFHALRDVNVPLIGPRETKLDFGRAAAGVVFTF